MPIAQYAKMAYFPKKSDENRMHSYVGKLTCAYHEPADWICFDARRCYFFGASSRRGAIYQGKSSRPVRCIKSAKMNTSSEPVVLRSIISFCPVGDVDPLDVKHNRLSPTLARMISALI